MDSILFEAGKDSISSNVCAASIIQFKEPTVGIMNDLSYTCIYSQLLPTKIIVVAIASFIRGDNYSRYINSYQTSSL